MKNFTKQILNKTLFKPTRWLLVTLMFLLGTSGAWADAYLSGGFNSWGATAFTNGTCSVTLNANTTYEFKIRASSSNWNTSYGNGGTMTPSNCTGWTMSSSAGNCKIKTFSAGTYVFTYDESTKKLSVTYPSTQTYTATIKFKRPSSWTKTPNIHIFYDSDNVLLDNKPMTKEDVDANGDIWYYYEYSIAICYTSATIMFNNGGWGNGQTAEQFKGDLGKDYCLASASSTSSTKGNVTEEICPVSCTPPAAPTLNPNSTTVCSGTSFNLPSGYRWYTAQTGGTKLSSNTISAGVTAKTIYYAEAGEDGCVSTSRTAYTVNVDPKSALTLKANPTICQGSSIKLSEYVQSSTGTVKWYSNSGMTTEIANPSEARTPQSNPTYYYARATSGVCSSVDKTLTVTLSPKPVIELTSSSAIICNGEKITFSNYEKSKTGTVTWHTDPDCTSAAITTASPTANTTYYAKATSGTCTPATAQLEVVVNDKPATPTVTPETIVLTSGSATLTISNPVSGATYTLYKDGESTGETGTQFTIKSQGVYKVLGSNDCGNSSFSAGVLACAKIDAPTFEAKSMTICEGEPFDLPTPNNLKDGEECAWSISGRPTPGHQSGISITATYQAVKSNDIGCKSDVTEFVVNVTPIPTISGATYTQPGKDNAIELTLPAGISAQWSVSPAADLSVNEGNSTMFSAEANGTYTITADNKGCTDTHVVTVSDAFYVYMRQPKKGETAYDQFYYPVQNPTQGGDLFYKEYASIPPAEGYTDYNTGGVAHDIIFTDCDGYVWYGFKASDKLIDGTNYFTVRAPNLGGNGGYYTHTYLTKPGAMTSDIYYTMSEEASGNSRGWYITKVSAPYSGPVVHASGNDFSFNKNNFADFVALYVTDCSGKEVKSYQWQYSATENGNYANYSSVCTYVGKKSEQGDAGKTNNIRPNVAGWYRCTATYKDGSSVTSTAKQVTDNDTKDVANYATFTSDLPIIMVNTNGYGFPSCDGLSGTASKNADVIKAKISVDVKIKLGNDIVYDRKARMNYRGSSSLNFVKKSYAFCPGKADCVEDKGRVDYVKTEKLNMLNVGSAVDKDWVLYAAAADPSIMRNRLVFDTFRDMTGSWSVQSRYVELIVDGEYKGIYVFMDKITNNANRVNITDENGFILKFDKTDIVDRYEGSGDKKTFKSLYSGKDGSGTYDTQIDQRFEIEYPEMEDVEEEEAGKWATTVNNIKSMINNFETQLKAGNYAEVQKIIDYKSWADWFIITEYAKNMDAYRASCLFVYNGDKLEARPLWDQELSFKNYCATLCDDYSCDNEKGLLIRTSKIYNDTESCSAPFWFTGKYVSGRGTEAIGGSQQFAGYLLNDPCFVQTVKDRWNDHKGKALSTDSLNAKLARYTNEMATALDREKSMWKSEGGKLSRETCQCSYSGTTGYSDIKISDSKGDITEWISARPAELDKALLDEVGTGLSISFSEENINTTPWEPVILQVHNESGYDYVLTYTDNALDQLTGVIIEKNGDTYKYNIPRPANWGTGDEATEGERANIVYGLKATLQMDSSNVVCGSQAEVPFDEATITLQDEPNEDCVQP